MTQSSGIAPMERLLSDSTWPATTGRRTRPASGRTKNASGEWVDETTWVRVTVTGQRAESLGQYLKKGSRVYVDGRLEARPWTDSRGEIKAGLELMANDVEFMSPRGQEDQQSVRQPVSASATPGKAQGAGNDVQSLEDLPF
jgi:single stranded DNA-binding protein